MYQFPFSPARPEDSHSYISLPTLGMVSHFNFSYPKIYVVVSHDDLNLHFPKSNHGTSLGKYSNKVETGREGPCGNVLYLDKAMGCTVLSIFQNFTMKICTFYSI